MTGTPSAPRRNHLASSRPEDALRPPALTIGNLARDLGRHIGVYRRNRLGVWTAIAFLALRVVQHVAYDRGWKHGLLPSELRDADTSVVPPVAVHTAEDI